MTVNISLFAGAGAQFFDDNGGDWPVITVDTDFRIYRRHQREVIPVLMPPEE